MVKSVLVQYVHVIISVTVFVNCKTLFLRPPTFRPLLPRGYSFLYKQLPSCVNEIEVYTKVNESININNLTDGYYIYGLFFNIEPDLWIMYNSYKRLTKYDTLHALFIFNITKENDKVVYSCRHRKFLLREYIFYSDPFEEEGSSVQRNNTTV